MHWWQKYVKNAHFGEVSGENKDTGEHVTLGDICWALHLLMKPRSASIETSVLPLSSTRRPAFPFSVLSQHPRKWLGPALIPFCKSAGPQTCSLTLSFQRDVSQAYTPCWTILAVKWLRHYWAVLWRNIQWDEDFFMMSYSILRGKLINICDCITVSLESEMKGERESRNRTQNKRKKEIGLKRCKILILGRLRVKLFRLEHSSYDETHLE